MMTDSRFKMHSGLHNYVVSEMIPLNSTKSVRLCDIVHVCTWIHVYCMCMVRPGWSPAGGMIPACIRPLWDSMW